MSLYNKNGIILCILSLLCEFIPCCLKSSAYDPLHKFLPIVFMSNTLENNLLDPWTVVPWTSFTCSSCMKNYTSGGSSWWSSGWNSVLSLPWLRFSPWLGNWGPISQTAWPTFFFFNNRKLNHVIKATLDFYLGQLTIPRL